MSERFKDLGVRAIGLMEKMEKIGNMEPGHCLEHSECSRDGL